MNRFIFLTMVLRADGIDTTNYPRRTRSAIGVDIVFTLDVCMFVC